MSRIGKKPVEIPSGVEVAVSDGNVVTVKGPRGELTQPIHTNMRVVCRRRHASWWSAPTTRASTAGCTACPVP